MILYFVRHGETDWNVEGRLQGEADILLNRQGEKLAEITGEKLKDIVFDLAISSPYKRAVETARIIMSDKKVPLILDDRIREIDWGEWDGLNVKELEEIGVKQKFDMFYTDPFQFKGAPRGESIEQVCDRGKRFYDELIHNEKYEEKTILIVTHGCAVRGILNHLYPDSENFWQKGVPANCAINIIEVKNGMSRFISQDAVLYDKSLITDYYTLK